MEVWMANMDLNLALDADKVIVYMKKYVTKPEIELSSNMNKMILDVINETHIVGSTTKEIKKMLRILGLCTLSKQKSCHLFI